MSRSRRKKKRRVGFSRADGYTHCVTNPESPDSSPSDLGPRKAAPSAACRGQQPDMSGQYPKLPPREVPVLGPSESGNQVLFHIEESYARDLIQQGKCKLVPITKHLNALRIIPPPPPQSDKAVPLHQKSIGDPHSRDTRGNPRGCFTFEWLQGKEPATCKTYRAIPPNLRRIFHQVILDCLEKTKVA